MNVVEDFGTNVTLDGGLVMQTLDTWKSFIRTDKVILPNNAGELYFEDEDLDTFCDHLKKFDIRFVHPLFEHRWGQRVVRFYDPDKHIIRLRGRCLCCGTGRTLLPNRKRDIGELEVNENMKGAVLYIHGKGGSAVECEHYRPLFPDRVVFGLDYQTFTPWETGPEIRAAVEKLKDECTDIILIANSIGAYFSMSAGIDGMIREAYFISPIVDMGKLIGDMMQWASVTETELKAKGVIHTEFG